MWTGDRYFLLPGCAFIFLVAAWLETLPRLRHSRIALPLLFALGVAGNFRVSPYTDFNWPGQALQVRQWQATGRGVELPVPPGEPWAVQLAEPLPRRARRLSPYRPRYRSQQPRPRR